MRILALICLVLVAGCESAVIYGTVVDSRNQTLPGVAVRVEGTPYESLSNGNGEYHVRYAPRPGLKIAFAKTGYTSFTLPLDVQGNEPVEAPPVMLAPLPESPGVFLYENFEYRRTTFVTPDELKRKSDNTIVFGTLRQDLVETLRHAPPIGIYRGYQMPAFGIRLNSLEETEVEPLPGYSGEEGVVAWTRGAEVPIDVRPVDSSNRGDAQLLQVFFMKELEVGAYAIHWGALDGDPMSEERRMFCFKVVDELTPKEAAEEPTEETATDGEEKPADEEPDGEATPGPAEDDEG